MEWASKILAEIRFAEKQLASPTESEVRAMDINSDANETHPVMTVDGKTLFFLQQAKEQWVQPWTG